MDTSEYSDDQLPTDAEAECIRALTAAQVAEIDGALLSYSDRQWRKMAMVVAKAMRQLREVQPELPDAYYAIRLAELVQNGRLEAQGNLRRMRFCEIRLSQAG